MSLTILRPLARAGVVLAAVLTALVASVVVAASASAHVTVSSADAAAGGYGKITFRVPDESATASTVSVRISIPETEALASLQVQPVPGWTTTTTSAQLAQPETNDDGTEVTSYVSVVEFRADAGGGITPGQFQEFSLSGGPFPDTDTLSFPVVQTYSDGTESAWIDPTVAGQPEPENPAPTLSLTADAAATATAAASEHAHGTPVSNEPVGLALFLAILALAVGLAGVVLGYRAGRRTVSS